MSLSEQFGDGAGLVQRLGAVISMDGLADLLAGFNDAGQESEVESWVGTIATQPTDPDSVKRALGRTRVEHMAEQLGSDPDSVAAGLARIIPTVVDVLTPGGQLPSGEDLDGLDLGQRLSGVDVGALLR